jgi:hypothetical protein
MIDRLSDSVEPLNVVGYLKMNSADVKQHVGTKFQPERPQMSWDAKWTLCRLDEEISISEQISRRRHDRLRPGAHLDQH